MNNLSPATAPPHLPSVRGPSVDSHPPSARSAAPQGALPNWSDWLSHRAALLSLSWPQGVADASGVSAAMLMMIRETQTLRGLGRSARGYLARSLKVSLRELEALAAGEIDWIADDRVLDIDRVSPHSIRPIDLGRALAVASSARQGVPILGRILETGMIEHFEAWATEDGPRIAIRYPGVPDAFALELAGDLRPYVRGECLVFQTVPPGELADGEPALLTADETELRIVRRDGMSMHISPVHGAGQASRVIAMADILRAAQIIDRFAAPHE
ncbi:MAG TPA: hypothetical protein VG326_13985 [Tepidisphaeraceae bacterium]|jgi:hypothetical protein|nr:hypothetical protein [Tepidisphaeraceae bacterium]